MVARIARLGICRDKNIVVRIGITPGEPAGIGPELLLQAVANQRFEAQLVAIADADLLRSRAKALNLEVNLEAFDPASNAKPINNTLYYINCPQAQPSVPGQLNKQNGGYVLDTLRTATQMCLSQQLDAIATGPVHKGIINDSGMPFTGHTEFFAEQSNCEQVVMMLATQGLRVALATTHLPLRAVADAITQANLQRTCEILYKDLTEKFGIAEPRILVCGLNPHAGEGGHLGMEEIEVIEPVLHRLNQQGLNFVGPLPADTLFTEHHLTQADAVLAMYHDQGLPVLKHKGFGKAINITLGLPFIRTSVDHGTALDLAGTGRADCSSFCLAIQTAIEMSEARRYASSS